MSSLKTVSSLKAGRTAVSVAVISLWLRACDAPAGLRSRLAERSGGDERGSVTLEQVIITGALVGLAAGLVAIITVAVSKYSAGIK